MIIIGLFTGCLLTFRVAHSCQQLEEHHGQEHVETKDEKHDFLVVEPYLETKCKELAMNFRMQ